MAEASSERFALYKLLIEQANVIAEARRDTNRFFLTFHTATAAALAVAISRAIVVPTPLLIALALTLIVVSMLWWALLRYYGRLAGAKFEIIIEVEKGFDIQPFALEESKVWKGKKPDFGATAIEGFVPLVFVAGYIGFIIFASLS